MGTPSHLGHMDRVAATMPSQAHAGAAQEAPDIGQWEGQDVPLVRPSSCNVKGGIPSSRRYLPLPTFLTLWDRYGLCEAIWERGFAFVQPDGSINPIFRSYLVENKEGQLLTRAETLSQRKKKN